MFLSFQNLYVDILVTNVPVLGGEDLGDVIRNLGEAYSRDSCFDETGSRAQPCPSHHVRAQRAPAGHGLRTKEQTLAKQQIFQDFGLRHPIPRMVAKKILIIILPSLQDFPKAAQMD